MSTIAMIGSAILTWVLLSVLTALVVGMIIRRRDGHRTANRRSSDTDPRRTPASGAAQSSSKP